MANRPVPDVGAGRPGDCAGRFSRIELGVHWTTDVVMSMVWTTWWIVVLVVVVRRIRTAGSAARDAEAVTDAAVSDAAVPSATDACDEIRGSSTGTTWRRRWGDQALLVGSGHTATAFNTVRRACGCYGLAGRDRGLGGVRTSRGDDTKFRVCQLGAGEPGVRD